MKRGARIAFASGILAVAAVITLTATGWLVGPAALLLAVLAWVFVPTAHGLSARVAINGALVLGFAPIVLWGPSLRIGNVGVVGMLLALAAGVIVTMLVAGQSTRRRVLPQVDVYWWLPVATALFSVWYFWPFLRARSGSASLAMLIQAFGGDNVAHFDMFAMIRTHAQEGLGWGAAADGSTFEYTNYPQHFHALAAMGAELWAGAPTVGENQAGLFAFSTALVLTVALITLAAAFASSRVLRGIPGLPAISVAVTISVLFLGAGVTNLSFGFPGFVLGLLGSIIAIVIAASRRRATTAEFAAVGGLLVLVAHCWILLAPLVGIPFLLMIMRMPWRAIRARKTGTRRLLVIRLSVTLVVTAACVYAVLIVLGATSSAGSLQAALGTPGGLAPLPIPVGISLALATIAISVAALSRTAARQAFSRRQRVWQWVRQPYVLFGVVAAVMLAEAGGLTIVQLIRAHFISYFQYKLFNGLILVLAVVLTFAVSVWIAEAVTRNAVAASTLGVSTAVALLCLAMVVLSGLPTGGKRALVGQAFASEPFRTSLDAAANNPAPGIDRLAHAAAVMAKEPCVRPFYLAAVPGDFARFESSQWAMALSQSWTASGSKVSGYYIAHDLEKPSAPGAELRALLTQNDARCAVVAPSVRAGLDASLLDDYGSRILSWK